MSRSTAFVLAAALAVGATSNTFAADLLPPPPPLPPPEPIDYGGWYLRGDVGVGINQATGLRSTFDQPTFIPNLVFNQQSIADSGIIGAGFGYRWNHWLRFDITGEYRSAAAFRSTNSFDNLWGIPGCSARCYDLYQAQTRSAVFLANAYFDLGTWYGITPFIGGGVGVANNWFQSFGDFSPQTGGIGFASDVSQAKFAWAVMAGLGYRVTRNLELEFGYRYLDMGRVTSGAIVCDGGCTLERQSFNLASHDIRLGFRYALADFAPMAPPPGPLITKY